jgi:hypothetical protein
METHEIIFIAAIVVIALLAVAWTRMPHAKKFMGPPGCKK